MLKDFSFKDAEENYSKLDDLKLGELGDELAVLQRKLLDRGVSTIIYVDGWESSGKGYLNKELSRELDPRYFNVRIFKDSGERFPITSEMWQYLPKFGNIGFYDRAPFHYLVMGEKFKEKKVEEVLEHFNNVEKTLLADNNLLIKFFLHIKEKTQEENIEGYLKDEYKKLYVTKEDREQNSNYDKYLERFSEVLEKSSRECSWNIVIMEDRKLGAKYALVKTISAIKEFLEREESKDVSVTKKDYKILENVDLNKTISEEEYDKKLEDLQERAGELVERMFQKGISGAVVFEGTDAAGKGRSIKRLTRLMDPRIAYVATTASPNERENSYNYLWRFYRDFPHRGNFVIFDRSWYGRVMVERVEGFAKEEEWERAYDEIANMERELVDCNGFVLKFFITIDSDE